MKTSRPDGISQENRTHPFFILLRKCSETQQTLAYDAMRSFVKWGIAELVISLFYLVIGIFFQREVLIWLLIHLVWKGSLMMWNLHDFRETNALCCHREVERMIYSNDFQYQSFNNEQLVNSLNSAHQVSGRLYVYQQLFDREFTSTIFFHLGIVIYLLANALWRFVYV